MAKRSIEIHPFIQSLQVVPEAPFLVRRTSLHLDITLLVHKRAVIARIHTGFHKLVDQEG